MKVFVLNQDGTPLMPMKPARARRKLRDGRATVERLHPFTIRLVFQVKNPAVQDCTLGIDDGAAHVGLAVVQHCKNEDRVIVKAELKLRRDVKKLVGQRRSRRRARRSRGPHRKPRHRRATSGLCPSAKVRKENTLRVVRDLVARCPITSIVIEEASFNTKDPRFAFWGTQTQLGKNWLRERLERIAPVSIFKGWETARLRKSWGIKKSHANDAVAITLDRAPWADCGSEFSVTARRRRQDMHNRKYNGFAGFRHWDIVKYTRRSGESFLGTVRSFVPSRKVVKCRLPFNNNYGVSVGRLRLVERPGALVYLPQTRKE